MLNTLGIIELRGGCHQAEAKVSRKLGGKSLLELVVRHVTDCQRLDGVVVLVPDGEGAAKLRRLVPPDVPAYIARGSDALARFVDTLAKFPARAMIRLAADNPFVDPLLIDRLVSTADCHPECDYISYRSSDGRPTILTQIGVFAEWCSAASVERAHRDARRAADRQTVAGYIHAHPEEFNVRLIPLPVELDRDDVRLKIDREEDWDHAHVLYEALGPEDWGWRRIAEMLDTQPALRRRMADLNRATSHA